MSENAGLPAVEPQSTDPAEFTPKPTLAYASAVGFQAAAVGAFVSAIQNALGTHKAGASGFLTRTGGTIGFFGASACANGREHPGLSYDGVATF